jgi:hypothetical protein
VRAIAGRAIDHARALLKYPYDLVSDQLLREGKGICPALCLATCRAFGAKNSPLL